MRLPWVGRAWHESELARAEAICRVQRSVQDAVLERERALHDAARDEVRRLTDVIAESIKPATKGLVPLPPALDPVVQRQIADSARGDDQLAKLLTDRAKQMRTSRPDATPEQMAYAIRYAEALPDAATAAREMAVSQ